MSGNLVLCGPMVRRAERGRVSIFVATRRACTIELSIYSNTGGKSGAVVLMAGQRKTIALGPAGGCHVAVVTARGPDALAWGGSYHYDLAFVEADGTRRALDDDGVLVTGPARDVDRLRYRDQERPGFVLPPADPGQLRILHGSCRLPHGPGVDALPHVDDLIREALAPGSHAVRPHQLFLTGDQIYADDVDKTLLIALRSFAHAAIGSTEDSVDLVNQRAQLVPGNRKELIADAARLTTGARSTHLITLGEFYAMHLFVWSGEPWQDDLGADAKRAVPDLYLHLPQVRRALANIPTYTIFDDHEVTDDWNIRAEWADAVLATSMGRRIVRNGLSAYAVFQHWGNAPAHFEADQPGGKLLAELDGWGGTESLAGAIDRILPVPRDAAGLIAASPERLTWSWHWHGAGHHVIGLDTRTRRRLAPGECSLMTEADIDAVMGAAEPAPVTVVLSGTPVLGVELLEWLQHFWPIERDHESWAQARTRGHLIQRLLERWPAIVLSGDVHFGFGSSLHEPAHPERRIVNFTSSGLKNRAAALFENVGLVTVGVFNNAELQGALAAVPDGLVLLATRSEQVVDGATLVAEVLTDDDGGEPAAVVAAPTAAAVVLQAATSVDRTAITRATNLGDVRFDRARERVIQELHYRDGDRWLSDRQVARCWLRSGGS